MTLMSKQLSALLQLSLSWQCRIVLFLLFPRPLLNPAKVMSSSQVEVPNAARSRTEMEIAPQGLKRVCENSLFEGYGLSARTLTTQHRRALAPEGVSCARLSSPI
jgi:hypothetical protein